MISIIDIKKRIIPNSLLLIGILLFGFACYAGLVDWKSGLIGCGIMLAFYLIFYFVAKGKIGVGDVKLAALCGILIGFPKIGALMLFTGFLIIFITVWFTMKHKKTNDLIPYAPMLCGATIAALLAGDWVLGIMAR